MSQTGSGLELQGIHKTFGEAPQQVDVLRGVDLSLAPGDALAITGPSGSGKSTLLHIVGGMDRPTSGQVQLAGEDPFALKDADLARFRNRRIGFVFQDHHLLPQYSVIENVLMPTQAFERTRPEHAQRAKELLERVGLSHRVGHRPAELSGGERQRAAVARALINDPALVLCDEPTGSLDEANAGAVADLLFELHEAAGTILIVVTHSLALAGRFPKRADMREGRLVAGESDRVA